MGGHRSSRAYGSAATLITSVAFGAIKAVAAVDNASGLKAAPQRSSLALFNDTDQPVYVYFTDDQAGVIAGTVKPTVKVASGQYYEDPANWQGWVFLSTAPVSPGGAITAPTLGTVNFTEWL